MLKNDCLDEQEEIVTEKLASAFDMETIDIQILSSALGRQGMDEDFLNS